MITRLFTRDISLVFVASFFYMSCSFIATPLIASYSESLGAGAVFMGVIGATFNTVALLSRPLSATSPTGSVGRISRRSVQR